MNNFDIFKFKEDLTTLINNSGLMVGTAYYVLKDTLNELEKAFEICINEEFKKT